MRPVNLLPEEYRPRQPTGETKGGAYAVLGVLGVLLVMVLAYALVANQVNSRKSEIAKASSEAEQAEAQTRSQGAFVRFQQVKEQRERSVRELAASRFDWERLMREVALVMPKGTWLLEMAASATGDTQSASSGGTPSSGGGSSSGQAPSSSGSSSPSGATGGAADAEPASPAVKLTGCAKDQDDVATLMVRLRKLYRATDVELGESAEEESGSSSTGSGTGEAATPAAGSENCGPRRYKFDVTVTFSAASPPSELKKVPASLGGGS